MENILRNRHIIRDLSKRESTEAPLKNLTQGKINPEYTIKEIKTNDRELKHFLFTLGCYEGETVTVISVLSQNYVIAVKDARYSIDKDLAEAIMI